MVEKYTPLNVKVVGCIIVYMCVLVKIFGFRPFCGIGNVTHPKDIAQRKNFSPPLKKMFFR